MEKNVSTRILASGVVETVISGRATGPTISEMCAGFIRMNRGASSWLVRAEETTSYAPDAVTQAVTSFAELCSKNGLTRLVAVIRMPTVRMGAQVVSMSLRAAGSPLEIVVVESMAQAEAALAQA